MTGVPAAVSVEEVGVGVVLPLRSAVLRDGGPAGLPGDDDPTTVHLAARTPDGRVVGVVRLGPAPCPWQPAGSPWQLRGMATDPEVRGAGAGRALLAAGLAVVAARGGDLLWCNARQAAAGFYARAGFRVVTEPFDVDPIGPHVGMVTPVADRWVLPSGGVTTA
ncbi:GNAT family N-acetyltransferase [Geodermatophilus normandii]|uniref:GNAT family N-acetyltransferase n=1 Tax=Geodermatophilus normandii TaxID=1137989 RepID=A0A6P0GE47_9ACTN|nr:GNAT family N-acetyltransferase [Geodermatophilus normandii]